MVLEPIAEADLYESLRPFRVEPDTFESAVQEKIQVAESQQVDGSEEKASPLLEMAAAFLPLPFLVGSKGAISAIKMTPLAGKYKLLGFVALPAISLFVLIGSAMFGSSWIRQVQRNNSPDDLDHEELVQAGKQWWNRYKRPASLFYAAVILLPFFGSTWLLFLLLLISTGVLLLLLTALAKQGLGNRQVVGQSCLTGMLLLGQVMGSMPGIGDGAIHFFDQKLLALPFFFGILALQLTTFRGTLIHLGKGKAWSTFVFMTIFIVGGSIWFAKPTLLPLTPTQIKQHVESFDHAPHSSVSWRSWERVTLWTQQAGLGPDLSSARQLFAEEIAGEQNPFVLGSAFRTGLVETEQIVQLKDYGKKLDSLLRRRHAGRKPFRIGGVAQEDWVIRAAIQQGVLTDEDRDHLQGRLLATWDALVERPSLEDALYVTRLLEVISRPMDLEQSRAQVHDWLRQFHCKNVGRFQLAGGFKPYPSEKIRAGNLRTTWCAIELMKVYGIPDDFDMNWVRSFVKPFSMNRFGDERYVAAVTRDNMQRLSGIYQPTWLEYVVVERSMLAAILLVGLCIYATLSSPVPVEEC